MTTRIIDSKTLKKVAGAFPTGVTIVTTEKEDGTIHGMTASSFLSVSLDPALVSFCVKESAAIFPLLAINKKVGISILSAKQKVVSNQFAGFNKEDIVIPMEETAAGATVIKDSLAWYSTTIQQIIPAGDHYLVLCKIQDLHRAEEGEPLIYWSGYRTTSNTIL